MKSLTNLQGLENRGCYTITHYCNKSIYMHQSFDLFKYIYIYSVIKSTNPLLHEFSTTNCDLFSHSSVGQKTEIKVLAELVLFGGSEAECISCVFPTLVTVHTLSSLPLPSDKGSPLHLCFPSPLFSI